MWDREHILQQYRVAKEKLIHFIFITLKMGTFLQSVSPVMRQVSPRYQALKKKPMSFMLVILGLFFGLLFGFKALGFAMMKKYMKGNVPVVTVSAMKASFEHWQPAIHASGTVRAVKGVDVTSEVSGLVKSVRFKSGSAVVQEQILVELNHDAELAHLNSLQALTDLASITYKRSVEQYQVRAVSKAAVDASEADFKSKQAQWTEQKDLLARKTIKAPFAGHLGITKINEGQYINPGDKIVTLQALNPLYVDFTVPQTRVSELKLGQRVIVKIPGQKNSKQKKSGIITALDPKIDNNTRAIHAQAEIQNENKALVPGMFVSVDVETGTPIPLITLPQAAISYNAYGALVYIIQDKRKNDKSLPQLTAHQTFVTLGETRGDQVSVLKGLKAGDQVVTSGHNKLQNGALVTVNNSVVPANNPTPLVVDE